LKNAKNYFNEAIYELTESVIPHHSDGILGLGLGFGVGLESFRSRDFIYCK